MNMNKEYKAELRQIFKVKTKALKELAAHCRAIDSAIAKLGVERAKAKMRVDKEFQRWSKREAILQGRLS
jgi:hypothetical protein